MPKTPKFDNDSRSMENTEEGSTNGGKGALIIHDDLAWAKPLVDAARLAIEQGYVMSLEDHLARMAERLAAVRIA